MYITIHRYNSKFASARLPFVPPRIREGRKVQVTNKLKVTFNVCICPEIYSNNNIKEKLSYYQR